jgi:hypothetical protein
VEPATVIDIPKPTDKPTRDRPASQIQKIFDKSSTGGIDQVYIVVNGTKTDTVAIFIPVLEKPTPPGQTAVNSIKTTKNQPIISTSANRWSISGVQ